MSCACPCPRLPRRASGHRTSCRSSLQNYRVFVLPFFVLTLSRWSANEYRCGIPAFLHAGQKCLCPTLGRRIVGAYSLRQWVHTANPEDFPTANVICRASAPKSPTPPSLMVGFLSRPFQSTDGRTSPTFNHSPTSSAKSTLSAPTCC